MQNPFAKKKAPTVRYIDLPTPAQKMKRLENALAQQIKYGTNCGWAVEFLVDLRDIREELEKGNYVQLPENSLLLEL